MRKYKHKRTGNIAVETNSGKNYRVTEPRNFTVPKWIIEESDDWEEIGKCLSITEDGCEIYKGDITFSVRLRDYKIIRTAHYDDTYLSIFDKNNFKEFSTEEKAREYVEDNKPMYTNTDVKRIISQHRDLYIHALNECTKSHNKV